MSALIIQCSFSLERSVYAKEVQSCSIFNSPADIDNTKPIIVEHHALLSVAVSDCRFSFTLYCLY